MIAKPKILVLAHSPYVGGAELALASLIHSTRDDFEWTVVFAGKLQPDQSLTKDLSKFEVLDLPWWCYEARDQPRKVHKKALLRDLNKLKSMARDADILLTNTITTPWLGAVAAEINKPHIWYVHEFGNIDHNLQFICGYNESLKIIDQLSTKVLTIGDSVKSHISKIINERNIDIIHQAIDLEALLTLPVPVFTRPLRLLCMGAIKPSKGQLVAAKAVNALPSSYNFTLDIQGPNADQSYLETLQAQASSRVRITPEIYVMRDILESHDALLMCSENEALGRVKLEGLASGRPVVGYACPSTQELLADGRGLLYSNNSVSSLSEVLRKELLNFITTYSPEKNRAFVSKFYSEKRQALDFKRTVQYINNSGFEYENKFLAEYISLLSSKSLFSSSRQDLKSRIIRRIPQAIKKPVKKIIKK